MNEAAVWLTDASVVSRVLELNFAPWQAKNSIPPKALATPLNRSPSTTSSSKKNPGAKFDCKPSYPESTSHFCLYIALKVAFLFNSSSAKTSARNVCRPGSENATAISAMNWDSIMT